MAKIEKIARPRLPPPSRCPIEDLVEDTHIRPAALPARRCTAPLDLVAERRRGPGALM
jgi:hypothetical protein